MIEPSTDPVSKIILWLWLITSFLGLISRISSFLSSIESAGLITSSSTGVGGTIGWLGKNIAKKRIIAIERPRRGEGITTFDIYMVK